MRTPRVPLPAMLSLLALAPLGCERAGGGEAASGPPVDGGTVVIGITGEPDNLLDVTATTRTAQDIIGQMFLSLTEVSEDLLSHEPQLASSWEHSEDGLSIVFHLEPEARWHDGEPVTAADVVFSHDLQTDPVVGNPAGSWKRFIEGVDAVNEHTVRYRFSRRYPYQVMDASVGAVLPRHLLKDVPRAELATCEFARAPVGNGPFRFERWEAQQSVSLVANEDYFGGRPHLDRVVFRVVPDKTSLLTQLETGEVDVMEDVPPHEVRRVERMHSDLRVERFPGRVYTYIGWDSTNPLFESSRVRRALGMAIDRDGIIEALCYGHARPCLGPIHPMLWAYHPDLEPLPYDPARARQILAEEGWTDSDGDGWLDKDGQPFEFELKTNLGNQVRIDASVAIQSQLEKIGVKVLPRTYEWTVLWDSVIKHTYETAVLVGWSVGLKVDLEPIFHSRSLLGKFNHTGYSNEAVDRLIDEANAAETLEGARPLWYEAQEKIVEDQPYTFLFLLDRLYGVNERVRGTRPDPRDYFRTLEDWWIPAGKQRRRSA